MRWRPIWVAIGVMALSATVIGPAPAAVREVGHPLPLQRDTEVLGRRALPGVKHHGTELGAYDRTRARLGGLDVIVHEVDPVRIGSVGSFDVHVVQRTEPHLSAVDVTLTVSLAKGTQFDGAGGSDWKCRARSRSVTCHALQAITPRRSLDPVRIKVHGTKARAVGKMSVRTKLEWKTRADAVAIAEGATPSPDGSPEAQLVSWTDRSVSSVNVLGPLTIHLASVLDGARGLPAAGADLALPWRITGGGGHDVEVTLVQRCVEEQDVAGLAACDGQRAPLVAFPSGSVFTTAKTDGVATLQVPALDHPTTIVVEATAREGAATARHTLSLPLVPMAIGEFPLDLTPFEATLARGVAAPVAGRLVSASTNVEVSGAGASSAVAGVPFELKVTVPGQKVTSVDWTVREGDGVLTQRQTTRGDLFLWTPPAHLRGRSVVVTARAELGDGRSVVTHEIVQVRAPAVANAATRSAVVEPTPSPSLTPEPVTARTQALTDPEPSDFPVGPLWPTDQPMPTVMPWETTAPAPVAPACALRQQLAHTNQAVLGGWTLTVPPGSVSASCDSDAALAAGTLVNGQLSVIGATGVIDAAGLSITAGQVRLPSLWGLGTSLPLATSADEPLWRIEPDASGQWSQWGAQRLQIPALPFPQLPGWTWDSTASIGPDALGIGLSQQATGPDGAQLLVTGDLPNGGSVALTATIANLATFVDVSGSQVSVTGQGQLSIGPDGTVALRAQGSATSPVRLFSNATVNDLIVTWTGPGATADASGVAATTTMSGTMTIDGTVPLVMQVAGTYQGPDSWTMQLSSTTSWQVLPDLTLDSLQGTVTRAAPPGQSAATTIQVTARVANTWQPTALVHLDSVTVTMQNACPAQDAEATSACSADTVHVLFHVVGDLDLSSFSPDLKVPFTGLIGWIDLSLGTFHLGLPALDLPGLSLSIPGLSVLKLNGISLSLDFGSFANPCAPSAGAGAGYAVSFASSGSVLGKPMNFVGAFVPAGIGPSALCVVGTADSLANSRVPRGEAFTNVTVAYSTVATTVTTRTGGLLHVPASGIAVGADVALAPFTAGLSSVLGGQTTAVFTGAVDHDGGLMGSVSIPTGGPKTLLGSGSMRLDVSDLMLGFMVPAGAVDATIDITTAATLYTPQGPGFAAEEIPFNVDFAVSPKGTFIRSSLDTTRDPGRFPNGEWIDAFGISGVTLSGLAVGGNMGTSAPAIAFDAAGRLAGLPGGWVRSLGVNEQANIGFHITYSDINPCMAFRIAMPKGVKGWAVDLANAGILVADPALVVLSPGGCDLDSSVLGGPGGTVIHAPGGFSLQFVGEIAQVFPIQVNAAVTFPDGPTSTMTVDALMQLGDFDLSAIRMTGTTAHLTMGRSLSMATIGLGLKGTIGVGPVQTSLDVNVTNPVVGSVQFSGKVASGTTLSLPFGGFGTSVNLLLNGTVVGGQPRNFGLGGSMTFNILGQNFGPRVALEYSNGDLNRLSVHVSIGVDLGIATVNGDGWVDYSQQAATMSDALSAEYPPRPLDEQQAAVAENGNDLQVTRTIDVGVSGSLTISFNPPWPIPSWSHTWSTSRTVYHSNWTAATPFCASCKPTFAHQVIESQKSVPVVRQPRLTTIPAAKTERVTSTGIETQFDTGWTQGEAGTSGASQRLPVTALLGGKSTNLWLDYCVEKQPSQTYDFVFTYTTPTGRTANAIGYSSTYTDVLEMVNTARAAFKSQKGYDLPSPEVFNFCRAGSQALDSPANGLSLTSGAYLANTSWAGQDLSGMDLVGANLAGADLTGANLTGANLTGTDLAGADLTGATLDGAVLDGTILFGTTWVDGTVCAADAVERCWAGS
mgnify:CR=1 FL=1